jgi:two-component system, LytTR family, sensor kinase
MVGGSGMLEQVLATLLLRIAVAASLASVLIRSNRFKRMLLREDRSLSERLAIAVGCGAFFAAGVALRVLTRDTYQAMDIGLEGAFVLGLVGGYVTGLSSGILISLPSMLNGEFLSMLLIAAAGVLGGVLRDLAPEPEDIWRFSPFFDVLLYRLFRSDKATYDLRGTAFSLVCAITILLLEVVRIGVAALVPHSVFSLYRPFQHQSPLYLAGLFLSTLFAAAMPIKVWAASRNENKLETQQLVLNEARLSALQRQINPHFLFNTLNSIASLIRSNPEKARKMIYQLSNILRRLLRKQENLCPLREELGFIDDYLAIEMVRFGDKLRFIKEIDPDTLDRMVPSMLLQPVIENSIRHGLSSKVDGGMIRVRSRVADARLHLTVEDDGVGIPDDKLATLFESGIGVSNVNERLKVLFGDDYRMWIDSRPGEGTTTGIEIPCTQTGLAAVS